MRTDDPIRDFENYEWERAKALAELPVCSNCEEPITTEYLYEINGEFICETCMERDFRRSTDLYIGDYE